MKKLLTLLALLIGWGANAQTLGDVLTWKKGPGLADAKLYTTPVNSSLFSLNGSGNFALLAQSNFANASHTHPASAITDFNSVGDARWSLLAHTHVSANITDASTGGNGTLDAGKLLKFDADGSFRGASATDHGIRGVYSGSNLSKAAIYGSASDAGIGVYGISTSGFGGLFQSVSGLPLEATSLSGAGDIMHIHNSSSLGAKFVNDGGLEWTSATGAQTTATNLPVFGTATKGVAPASGGGTTNYLRADGNWASPPGGGSGTVTSVSVTTANGVSGSVANSTTTPAISLTLGAITPTSVAASGAVSGSNLSGTNTGDQTSIVGITGTIAQFNTACTDADFAPIASPTLTGTPAAPTAAANTNTTQIATTEYVQSELSALGTVATARTGAALAFDVPAVYNTAASPSASTVTVDWTGAVTGTMVKAWFNHSSEPTWPTGITVAGVWHASNANACTFTYHGSSTASGECVSDQSGAYTNPQTTYFPNVANVPTDFATTGTTAVQVAGLSGVPILAGKLYRIELVLRGSCSAAGGSQFGFFFNTGTDHILRMAGRQDVTGDTYCNITPTSGYNAVNTTHTWWPNNAPNNTGVLRGTIRGGAVNGTMELRAKSVTSGQTTTVYADGSYMIITLLN